MKKLMLLAVLAASFSLVAVAGEEEYKALDADQSGTISSDEAAANSGLSESFAEVDTNQDGEVDMAEFAQFEASQ
jgi:Ca2+-binding EF-hand superfamily protein